MFRNIGRKGLLRAFKTNREFRQWCGLVFSLPLLPEDFIDSAWAQVKEMPLGLEPHEEPLATHLKDYMEAQWIRGIGPAALTVAFNSRRTNNEAEVTNR